jgi:hypothetical protein
MKFEDALKIEGAESVGGQLIVNTGGRNVLIGKSVQGTLIVEDTPEARNIVEAYDDAAFRDGEEVEAEDQSRSPLSTDPIAYATHGSDPIPNLPADQQPGPGGTAATAAYRETAREALEPPTGSDPNTPHVNVEREQHDKADKGSKK